MRGREFQDQERLIHSRHSQNFTDEVDQDVDQEVDEKMLKIYAYEDLLHELRSSQLHGSENRFSTGRFQSLLQLVLEERMLCTGVSASMPSQLSPPSSMISGSPRRSIRYAMVRSCHALLGRTSLVLDSPRGVKEVNGLSNMVGQM